MTDSPIKPLDPAQTAKEESQTAREGYFHRVLVALDIFGNVVFGGQPDETISSHAARASLAGKRWGRWLSRGLNLLQRDHGADAIAGDAERARNVEHIEQDTNILH